MRAMAEGEAHFSFSLFFEVLADREPYHTNALSNKSKDASHDDLPSWSRETTPARNRLAAVPVFGRMQEFCHVEFPRGFQK